MGTPRYPPRIIEPSSTLREAKSARAVTARLALPRLLERPYRRAMIHIDTPGPWHRATFIERPNRFIVHASLDDSGQEVRTHLPDPGRLKELMIPGRTVWLKPADTPRKTAWSCIYVETAEGELVCCDTRRPNQLIGEALKAGAIDELAGWDFVRSESTWGSSRFDFLLQREGGQLYLEVKGVSWVEGQVARFPDAVTARGAKHLAELAKIAGTPHLEAAALFLLQRSADVIRIEAAGDRDPAFAQALAEAREAGVLILGRRARLTLDRTTLGDALPVR